MRSGVRCYGCDELQEHLETTTGEKIIGLMERKTVLIGSFWITPFYLPHTTKDNDTGAIVTCPNFGYLIEQDEMGKLLYMTDMEYSPFNFKGQRINHLVIEANYCEDMVNREDENYRHRLQGHCSLDTCKGIVAANKTPDLRTVTLIHLSDSAADPYRMKQKIQEIAGKWVSVDIAEKGKVFELSRFPWGG